MQTLCNPFSSPVKTCAKWLMLSLAFVWLIGCSMIRERKISKRDPFAGDKFSCGEDIPRGPAAGPSYASMPASSAAKISAVQANPAYSNGAYSNPAYSAAPYSSTGRNATAYSNSAYSNAGSGAGGYGNTGIASTAGTRPTTSNAPATRVAQTNSENAASSTDDAFFGSEATPASYSTPVKQASKSAGAVTQGTWYDADK